MEAKYSSWLCQEYLLKRHKNDRPTDNVIHSVLPSANHTLKTRQNGYETGLVA